MLVALPKAVLWTIAGFTSYFDYFDYLMKDALVVATGSHVMWPDQPGSWIEPDFTPSLPAIGDSRRATGLRKAFLITRHIRGYSQLQ